MLMVVPAPKVFVSIAPPMPAAVLVVNVEPLVDNELAVVGRKWIAPPPEVALVVWLPLKVLLVILTVRPEPNRLIAAPLASLTVLNVWLFWKVSLVILTVKLVAEELSTFNPPP